MKERKKTWLEKELYKRGFKDKEIWLLVSKKTKGMTKMQLREIFDDAHYSIGVQQTENVAMACGVSYMTVVDWIRLDKQPELMTKAEFQLYTARINELDNSDQIRWYLALMCRKKVPLYYIFEELLKKTKFKKPKNGYVNRKDYIYHNYIKPGILDSSKAKNPSDSKDKK